MTKSICESENISDLRIPSNPNYLIDHEIVRINDLILLQKNIKDAAVVSFVFDARLSENDKKYILDKILQKYPKISYATGNTYYKDGLHHNYYKKVNLANHHEFNHRYIIHLQ